MFDQEEISCASSYATRLCEKTAFDLAVTMIICLCSPHGLLSTLMEEIILWNIEKYGMEMMVN
jgi:hypothetical protein